MQFASKLIDQLHLKLELLSPYLKSSYEDISNFLKENPIRLGVVSPFAITDENAMSGTPASTYKALASLGFNMVDLSPGAADRQSMTFFPRVKRRLTKEANKLVRNFRTSESDYYRTIKSAVRSSTKVQLLLEQHSLDAIFGVCVSSSLYQLKTDIPIIYASDTTARSLNSTYPQYIKTSEGYKRACDLLEKTAFEKCRYFLPSSKFAAESAINDYGLDPSNVHVIEFGSHVTPSGASASVTVPDRNDMQLCLVAADPERKRLGMCIEIAEKLAEKGWNARLNYIGTASKLALEHPLVNYYGRLRLSEEDDRKIHEEVLKNSHWLLLPSLAEAYGIAPCEAAHFGRPSAVSSAGGLPTVVQHNKTGLVLPQSATASDYSESIERVSLDAESYTAMSAAALFRAQTVLNWDAWAASAGKFIIQAVRDHKASNA